VINVLQLKDNKWKVTSNEDIRKQLFNLALENGAGVLELTAESQKMEDLFKEKTGK
jgi:ABC-2 type transport system ATP-binding protein